MRVRELGGKNERGSVLDPAFGRLREARIYRNTVALKPEYQSTSEYTYEIKVIHFPDCC